MCTEFENYPILHLLFIAIFYKHACKKEKKIRKNEENELLLKARISSMTYFKSIICVVSPGHLLSKRGLDWARNYGATHGRKFVQFYLP